MTNPHTRLDLAKDRGGSDVNKRQQDDGLPMWLTITVVLVLLVLFAFNILFREPAEGYPTTLVIGGLLGAYAGVNTLVQHKRRNNRPGGE